MGLEDLIARLNPDNLPKHIGIIMDGNGRWAQKRLLPRVVGHRQGVKTVDRVVSFCRKIRIPALTLYSFSMENWNRPRPEVEALMTLLDEYLKKELDRMLRENIRFNTIGQMEDLPPPVQSIIVDAKEKTRTNDGMVLTLALSYGSQNEIVHAIRNIVEDVQRGLVQPEDINPQLVDQYLYTHDLPEVDLLIRTSGEYRLSNFLLWQCAYAELFFTDVLWPEFDEEELVRILADFQKRERRFGLTEEQIKTF